MRFDSLHPRQIDYASRLAGGQGTSYKRFRAEFDPLAKHQNNASVAERIGGRLQPFTHQFESGPVLQNNKDNNSD